MFTRATLLFSVVIALVVGIIGGYFIRDFSLLNAGSYPFNAPDSNLSQTIQDSIVRDSIRQISTTSPQSTCQDPETGDDDFEFPDIDASKWHFGKIDYNCTKATLTKYELTYKEFRKNGTDPVPWNVKNDINNISTNLIKLINGQKPSPGNSDPKLIIDTWLYIAINSSLTIEYYDENCKIVKDIFNDKTEMWVHVGYQDGVVLYDVPEPVNEIPNLSGYTSVKCIYFRLPEPKTHGSLENCQRCKGKPPVAEESEAIN